MYFIQQKPKQDKLFKKLQSQTKPKSKTMSNYLCHRKFLSLSVQLSLQACNIIKQFSVNKNMKTFQKGIDDHVTEADYKVQSTLIKGLKMYFPDLKIIGQQSQQFKSKIDFNYQSIQKNILPENLSINSKSNTSQSCLWIDPIDCTRGFIQGTLQDVTVLIGMSTNNKASLGVIGIPFKKVGKQRIFQPEILIGSIPDKHAYSYSNNKWTELQKRKSLDQLTVTTSVARLNNLHDKYVRQLSAKNILAGGSGRKVIEKVSLVVKGQADIMAYVGQSTSKWDSCAGQAIVKAIDGKFTDPRGRQITYNPHESFENKDGILCSLNHDIHKKSVEFFCTKYSEF